MHIPEHEIEFIFSHAGGKGGQNVNKTSTRVQAIWNIGHSRVFNVAERDMIRGALRHRLTQNDEIIISAAEERSQGQNKALAIKRLENLVNKALIVRKKRIPTKPSFSSRLKRLAKKRKISLLKRRRKLIED